LVALALMLLVEAVLVFMRPPSQQQLGEIPAPA
jgi:hypothetical protein